jgi:DNA-binding HxlR family transcriptional regulator
MQKLGQFCPVALASEVLTQRWMLLVVRELLAGSTRFADIKRGVPRISATLLKQRLDTLVQVDVVEHRDGRYRLTEAGLELAPVLTAIGTWGQRWAREIAPNDLDPGWLVWNMRRRLNSAAMPLQRTVIGIEFLDAAPTERVFWLVHENGQADVCLKPPGFPEDIKIRTTVRRLAEIWRGLRTFDEEIRSGAVCIEGAAEVRRAAVGWFLLSVYASTKRPHAKVPNRMSE